MVNKGQKARGRGMVIRRIREHVGAHDWFAVLVDVGIVVLGVFIGTQVSNWNEDRLDSARAANLRERLIDELDFDARQYALQFTYYEQAKKYGLQALAALNGARLSDRDFVVAAYQLTQTDTTKAKTNVYEEIAENGLVDRLGDAELQRFASDFYLSLEVAQRSIEQIYPYRTLLRETMPYPVQLKVRRECGDREIMYQGRLVGITTVLPCRVAIAPADAAAAARAIRATPGIEQQMTRYIASLDEKLDNLALARDQAKEFRNRLIAAANTSVA
jgi:hypothetical protein